MKEEALPWHELVARLQAASPDEAAWRELCRRLEVHARAVLRRWRGLQSEAPEDLVQQTIAKLLESEAALGRLDADRSPEAYLKTAVRNTARDWARRKVLALRALQQLAAAQPRPGEASAREDDRLAALTAEIARLPADHQELLRLRFWEGLSLADIAARRDEGYSAVAVRMFRILKVLRTRLGQKAGS